MGVVRRHNLNVYIYLGYLLEFQYNGSKGGTKSRHEDKNNKRRDNTNGRCHNIFKNLSVEKKLYDSDALLMAHCSISIPMLYPYTWLSIRF